MTQQFASFYLALDAHEAGIHEGYYGGPEDVAHEIWNGLIKPSRVLFITYDAAPRDADEEVAKEVMTRFVADTDDDRLDSYHAPAFCKAHLSGTEIDRWIAETLASRADEAAHVREVSSPEATGRI